MAAPTLGPASGAVLAGRYELVRRLGVGGMAEVFLAHDQRLSRDVAVKLLSSAYASDPTVRSHFQREARAAAALVHPHIVAVHDWGEEDGVGYLVMEHVPGLDLKALLVKRGALPESEALAIGEQIASALEVAHEHGLIHCDVKPHNILLDARGQAKVADFGIARAASAAQPTQVTGILASAHYLSPEQAAGRRLDARTDLYSLGVVLFELLTGQLPFRAESAVAVARHHVETPPPSPRDLRPDVSSAAEALVLKALAKDPAGRYQSAAEMRAALATVRAGMALPATERIAPAIATDATRRVPKVVAPAIAAPASGLVAPAWWPKAALLAGVLALFVLALPFLVAGASNAASTPTSAPAATATISSARPSPTPPATPHPTVIPTPPPAPAIVAPPQGDDGPGKGKGKGKGKRD